jgi:D-inositol-3-phosphate glycosyltransferase
MRIAMVSEHASPLAVLGGVDAGGQNVHVAALAAALARDGDTVVVHTRRDHAGLPRRVRQARGVTVDHVAAGPPVALPKDELLPHMEAFAADLHAQWTRDRPDVVHSHFWMSGLAALWAARDLGIPVAHTYHALGTVKRRHQGAKDTSPGERIGLEAWIAGHADRIVATCTDEVFELLRMGADRRRISVIPCGVDLGRFTASGPAEPRRAGVARLVAASRLVERKGIGNAVAALGELPGAELHVAGGADAADLSGDPEVRRLRALAASVGAEDRLVLRGRIGRDGMPPLLRSADVVVCAPWYEPFGIVPLEAMACGVPVVATAVGGQIDSVVHGVTGVHVPPRDPAALAAALRELLADPPRRAELGRQGRRRAQRLYSFDRIASATREVYDELVRRRRAGRRFGRRLADREVRA